MSSQTDEAPMVVAFQSGDLVECPDPDCLGVASIVGYLERRSIPVLKRVMENKPKPEVKVKVRCVRGGLGRTGHKTQHIVPVSELRSQELIRH